MGLLFVCWSALHSLANRFFSQLVEVVLLRFLRCVVQLGRLSAGQVSLVLTDRAFYARQQAIKLAIVNRRLAFICHDQCDSDASNDNPCTASFEQIESVVTHFGFLCFRDRRKQRFSVVNERRRKPKLSLLIYCSLGSFTNFCWANPEASFSGLSFSSKAPDNEKGFYSSTLSNATQIRTLGLFSVQPNSTHIFYDQGLESQSKKLFDSGRTLNTLDDNHGEYGHGEFSEDDYARARSVLFSKWRKSRRDVDAMENHLDDLAKYIASQPEAYALLVSLSEKSLRIAYKPESFTTVVKGNQFHVRSATIYFDPQSAAVLSRSSHCETEPGHCVASPADAFIHELIHAKIALLEPEKFIQSGAMNSLIYPYAHEREVLSQEREIYQSMTSHDNQPRPERHSHSGHLQAAACVSCLTPG